MTTLSYDQYDKGAKRSIMDPGRGPGPGALLKTSTAIKNFLREQSE